MTGRLVNIYGSPKSISLDTAASPMTIGRGAEADVCLADRWVSQRHCVLEWVGGELVLRDMNSTHGTYVNDQRVETARLLNGDRINIGVTTFIVDNESRWPDCRPVQATSA